MKYYDDPAWEAQHQSKIALLHDMRVLVDVLAAKGFLEQAFKECRECLALAEELAKSDPHVWGWEHYL